MSEGKYNSDFRASEGGKGEILGRLRALLAHAGFDDSDGLPQAFTDFVDALVQNPQSALPVAVGENGASGSTSTVFWAYLPGVGLHLEAKAGFLQTATGNGGFTLDVAPDGTWRLSFAGSTVRIGSPHGESEDHGHSTIPAVPAGNTLVGIETSAAKIFYDGSAGHQTIDATLPAPGAINPVAGHVTISAGVGDYLIGSAVPHVVGAPGDKVGNVGNCVIYTTAKNSSVPPGSVLVDMQNGRGYGSDAEGNQFVNIDQVRGSLQSNVLIGATAGSDLKSGGANSVLISTGGTGYELRPDGTGNVLVSTSGNDRVLFDPNRSAWALGDQTTMLGFRAGNASWLDLSLLGSNIHTLDAVGGYNPLTDRGDINAYVKLVETADGEKVMFSATGNVAATGVDLIDLKLTHGLTAQGLLDTHGLVI